MLDFLLLFFDFTDWLFLRRLLYFWGWLRWIFIVVLLRWSLLASDLLLIKVLLISGMLKFAVENDANLAFPHSIDAWNLAQCLWRMILSAHPLAFADAWLAVQDERTLKIARPGLRGG